MLQRREVSILLYVNVIDEQHCCDCSRMVYPVEGREEGGVQDLPEMTSGKYEPLVHMNALLNEEVRKTMAEVASECE